MRLEIKEISHLKYKDWGRLSRTLLDGMESVNNETGELNTIIGFLRSTNDNFMEIANGPKYKFRDEIKDKREAKF